MKIANIFGAVSSLAIIVSMGSIAQHAVASNMLEVEAETFNQERECLALNIYHEARSESVTGQRAVGWVTMNRVQSNHFPNTVCDVVYQGNQDGDGNMIRHQCSFSWYCDGRDDSPQDSVAFIEAELVAEYILSRHEQDTDPTAGADHYHTDAVNPYWASADHRTVQIDNHIFYGLYN